MIDGAAFKAGDVVAEELEAEQWESCTTVLDSNGGKTAWRNSTLLEGEGYIPFFLEDREVLKVASISAVYPRGSAARSLLLVMSAVGLD